MLLLRSRELVGPVLVRPFIAAWRGLPLLDGGGVGFWLFSMKQIRLLA